MARRASGEGSVYRAKKNGKTLWCAQLRIEGDSTGRVRYRRRFCDTQREALDALEDLRTEKKEGRLAQPQHRRVRDLITEYLNLKEGELREKVYALEKSRLENYVLPRIGNVRLRDLNTAHILRFAKGLKTDKVGQTKRGDGSRLRQHCFDLLSRVLRFGIDLGWLGDNPAARVRKEHRPKWKAKRVEALPTPTVGRLLDSAAAEAPWVHALVACGLSGLRLGECLALRWQDIDLASGVLRVERGQTEYDDKREGGRFEFGPPKTESSQRIVALAPWAHAALQGHRNAQPATPFPATLLFTTRTGTPLRRSNFTRREWMRVREAAGVPGIRFHDLRHQAASMLLAAGIDHVTVAGYLGHESAATTFRIYGHTVPGKLEEAAHRLGLMVSNTEQ